MSECRTSLKDKSGAEYLEYAVLGASLVAGAYGRSIAGSVVSKMGHNAIRNQFGNVTNAGKAYRNALIEQAGWVANASDLLNKIHNGTTQEEDYLQLANTSISTLSGAGLLMGLAAPAVAGPLMTAAFVGSIAIGVYTFVKKIQKPICGHDV
ncbi:hypothetical protein [Kingella kingae]|uniref:hypothetical protein n=1 Tax=Kingella kingae TaxID=504 RepID=UPI00254CEC7B|nr:hypothetical protein [Kingella kingae]MDK4531237.1 hypothetical protein [Kingella kingae]MDK4581481.1 hypothetical protein [Kingella kingae]